MSMQGVSSTRRGTRFTINRRQPAIRNFMKVPPAFSTLRKTCVLHKPLAHRHEDVTQTADTADWSTTCISTLRNIAAVVAVMGAVTLGTVDVAAAQVYPRAKSRDRCVSDSTLRDRDIRGANRVRHCTVTTLLTRKSPRCTSFGRRKTGRKLIAAGPQPQPALVTGKQNRTRREQQPMPDVKRPPQHPLALDGDKPRPLGFLHLHTHNQTQPVTTSPPSSHPYLLPWYALQASRAGRLPRDGRE
eukprot:2668587-Pyramimonas_sp.AAC.1